MNFVREIIKRIKVAKAPAQYYRSLGSKIGERCEIRGHVNFGSEPYLISIGNHVRINHGVQLITHDGGAWVLRDYLDIDNHEDITLFKRIAIGNNVHIGTNAMIMPGVTIGDNVIIGCGAIVTRDVPSNSVAVGIPARVIESIDDYYEKHKDEFSFTKSMSREQTKDFLLNG